MRNTIVIYVAHLHKIRLGHCLRLESSAPNNHLGKVGPLYDLIPLNRRFRITLFGLRTLPLWRAPALSLKPNLPPLAVRLQHTLPNSRVYVRVVVVKSILRSKLRLDVVYVCVL